MKFETTVFLFKMKNYHSRQLFQCIIMYNNYIIQTRQKQDKSKPTTRQFLRKWITKMEIHYQDMKNQIHIWHRHHMGFQPHFHSNLEIVYMLSGRCKAFVDFKEYILEPGDVLVNFPIQIHSYHDIEAMDAYLLIFPVSTCTTFSKLMTQYIPDDPVVRADKLDQEWMRSLILRLNDTNACKLTKFKHGTLEGYFTALLGELLPHLSLKQENRNYSTEHKIIAYCTEHFREELTLDSVSEALHISKYHVSHLFSNKMQVGFCAFVNSLRISEACRILKKGESVTDAALSSGFPSVRTFNRIFRSEYNMAPTEYLKKQIPKSN